MAKKQKTSTQIYKSNVRKVKLLKALSPIAFWGFLIISFFCLIMAIKGTFGNLGEMISLLDNDAYTGEELEANYKYLIAKYGEWVIGNGGAGFTVRFVDVKKVAFSGFALVSFFLFVFFLAMAFVLGKWVFPKLAEQIEHGNQDDVNLAILEMKEGK